MVSLRELSNVPTLGESHVPLMEVVATELRRWILNFELPPGTHLAENQLAKRLGVSRNPVREAIRILATEGFIEISPRRGAFVAHLDQSDAENLFDVRLVLEPLGARLAARHRSPEGTCTLRNSIEHARLAMEAGRLDEVASLNTEFHIRLVEMSGNPYLISITSQTIQRAQWVYRQNAATRAPHSWSEHAGLMEAIEVGDEELAEAEARRHVAVARHSFRLQTEQPG
jgi:DNA-binding GntR family transcriptional regulator